jgi:hypothetical protein
MTGPNCITLDRSPELGPAWAVMLDGRLLPIRFATDQEAALHLQQLGVPVPRSKLRPHAIRALVEELRREGRPLKEVAVLVGRSENRVRQIIGEIGCP